MSQHGTGKECTLVALVPTTKVRRELLFRRSIPSVLAQTRLPDLLIVVLDGDDDASLKEPLHQACRGRVDVIILRNFRTKGLSGTINTAIDWLQRDPAMRRDDGIDVSARADQVYAAIIDDDDHWEPDHLRLCLRAACDCDLHMVAAGLVRRSGPNDPGKEHDIPQQLNPREQFIRGQHIQGSNLFVRLDALLNAGCFDERLPSCTDRDLCIRLARLPDFRFGCISQHTVHHFAEPRPDRLSTPGSNTKLDGLDRFWSKYQAQFDDDARAQFLERAADLFGWTPAPVASVMKSVQDMATPPRAVDLVVGFVTDSQINAHARELLEDLLLLSNRPGINSLVTVVIENGPVNGNLAMRPIQAMVNDFLAKGLEVDLITVERQINDWTHCRLIDTPNPEKQRLPIAVARTILNTYVARAAQRKPGSWAWILDDDKRLFIRLDMGDSRTEERPSPDLASLCALQDAGCDVVIGPDCGAPPLPFTATLRMPLVDLAHNLNIVANLHPDAPWPSCPERPKLKDFYYDLSRETEHLETPFALRPAPGRSTAAEVLSFLGGRADRLLAVNPYFGLSR